MNPDATVDAGALESLQTLAGHLGRWGDAPAILSFGRETAVEVTYAELATQARKFAEHLRRHEAHPGDPVVLLGPPSPAYIAAALGTWWLGAAVAPIDAQFSDEVLRHVFEDSGAKRVVTTAELADRLEHLVAESNLQVYLLDSAPDHSRYWLPGDVGELEEPAAVAGADAVAALFYTSGTTGMPKGVPLTHRNVAYQLTTIREEKLVEPGARLLLPLPLHHVYPFVIGTLAPLSLGVCIVLPASLTGPQLIRALQEGHVTHLIGVPRLYDALLSGFRGRIQEQGRLASAGFAALFAISRVLRRVFRVRAGKVLLRSVHRRLGPEIEVAASGGAPLADDVAWDLETLGWKVGIGYGLTETSPLLTINAPGAVRIGSVGRVVDGTELRIVPVQDVPAPVGEVQARGPGVFHGYHNLPEKTREAFTEDGWFRTGDLGRLDDENYLYLSGRASTLIVMPGGENIQPEDLERAYAEPPAITEIGVLQHDSRLVAVVVPDSSAIGNAAPQEVRKAVQRAINARSRTLPSYQRLSDFVVTQEALARTRIGKIQRHTLQERFEELERGEAHEAPGEAGPIAIEAMSDRDRDLLDVDSARRAWEWLADKYGTVRLTPDTDVRLELDIDSLEWINITERIREITGVELTEDAVGRIETVRDLLAEVAEGSAEAGAAAEAPELFDNPDAALTERQRRWLEPLPGAARAAAWLIYRLDRALVRTLFRLRVEGLDRVPRDHPFIIAPNHTSYLDPFVVAAALGFDQLRNIHWGGWTGAVLANRGVRLVTRLAQTVPIEGERGLRSSLAAGAAVLKRNRSLVWFPEGARSPDGELKRFRPGIGMLLTHFDVPVVPVHIRGAYESLPRGSRRLRLRPIRIVFGTPVRAEALEARGEGEEAHDRIANALHDAVAELGRESVPDPDA